MDWLWCRRQLRRGRCDQKMCLASRFREWGFDIPSAHRGHELRCVGAQKLIHHVGSLFRTEGILFCLKFFFCPFWSSCSLVSGAELTWSGNWWHRWLGIARKAALGG